MTVFANIASVNRLGAVVVFFIYGICTILFCARLAGKPRLEHWLGLVLMLAVVPLTYLLVTAKSFTRPPLYYVQISLMIVYLLVELLLDYVFNIDFRNERWMVITYVTLFFAATGGMLGVAATAGRTWSLVGVGLFLTVTVLALVQHAKTGM